MSPFSAAMPLAVCSLPALSTVWFWGNPTCSIGFCQDVEFQAAKAMPGSLQTQSQELWRCRAVAGAYVFVVARDAADEGVDAATQGACTGKERGSSLGECSQLEHVLADSCCKAFIP